MLDFLLDPAVWASLLSLAALEIVLGIDNVVFISLISSTLPHDKARLARQIGLALALLFRIALLFAITWIMSLRSPVIPGIDWLGWLSWRDLILIAGGLFLIVKATQEMHGEIEGSDEGHQPDLGSASFNFVIGQIILVDMIFSIDSIITALGMVDDIRIMIAAVMIAVTVMYFAADTVARFIETYPTTKMLALSFLLLIGVALVADGFGSHIERKYIYFAIAFAVMVELFNVMALRRAHARKVMRARKAAYRHRQAKKS